ncbi:hypothetical protein LBMAG53_39440 [Planctomycetota bacterium]|nr:hypothetical protein LBMAG53_39440 [Planctomycetota bacterium]
MRSESIDLAKALLVIAMILVHAIQFCGERHPVMDAVYKLGDLTIYSGFLICFGYACQRAYLSRPTVPWGRVAATVGRLYLAYAISAAAFRVVIAHDLNPATYRDLLLLRIIPNYAEFFLGFALSVGLAAASAPILRPLLDRTWALPLMALPVLAIGLIPAQPVDPLIGLWVGGSNFAYFPVLTYFPLFLLGAWLARHDLRIGRVGVLVASPLVVFGVALALDAWTTSRFPPSPWWVVTSAGLAVWAIAAGELLDRWRIPVFTAWLAEIGHRILFYVLVSNILLMCCNALQIFQLLAPFQVLVLGLATVALCSVLSGFARR